MSVVRRLWLCIRVGGFDDNNAFVGCFAFLWVEVVKCMT